LRALGAWMEALRTQQTKKHEKAINISANVKFSVGAKLNT
jgi:hypothetical protein